MNRVRINFDEIDQDRFWDKVDKTTVDACWPWRGGRDKDGYGYFRVGGGNRRAHRVAYVVSHGSLEPALDVCHACDNPRCVNPRHLWVGTNQDNSDDMVRKGRSLCGIANPKVRLSERKVQEVVRLADLGLLQKEIAQRIGCNQRTVSTILTGRQWARVTGRPRIVGRRVGESHPKARLTALLARRIAQLGRTQSATAIAALLDLPRPTVYSVLSGQTWNHVTGVVHG